MSKIDMIAKKFRNRIFAVDFDDYCDATVGELEILQKLRDRYPEFTCTLFTIPSRTSPSTIAAANEMGDWIKLAPHGYFHTRGECYGWTEDEACEKIEAGRLLGISERIFRAPGWLLDANVYDACERMDYVVASHVEFRIPPNRRTSNPREYIYNTPIGRAPGTRSVHGHMTPVSGNYIRDMWDDGRLGFGKRQKFITCVEAAV